MDFFQTDIPSVQDLLSGGPFVPFSEFSAESIEYRSDEDVLNWIESKLEEGKPFIIRGFKETEKWRRAPPLDTVGLNLSDSEAIPVRNCETGRDVKMRLRDLLSHTDIREYLYAKDLHCPQEWVKFLEAILPPSLTHLGPLDLLRVLPPQIAPEVLMAYIGTRKSFSGFHRCFSATVALNLLIESEGNKPGSICFGTDKDSQAEYDIFMENMGKSPHTDWTNVTITKLSSAKFPIYITQQSPGDLVVFPATTAHQIWNIAPMVIKVVWNIMHYSSISAFFEYIQPAYQRNCHSDTGRAPLIPIHGLEKGPLEKSKVEFLLNIFQQMVNDEDLGQDADVPVQMVDTQGAVVECNFCGLTIWNRHLHCERCGDFDLCLTCYVSGRSCQHIANYTWAEIIPRERCREIIRAVQNKYSGVEVSSDPPNTKRKSLGAIAVAAADARQQCMERLCHLCRDSHSTWKGISCSKCSAFFCFRGLYRHFDVDFLSLLREGGPWTCFKCLQVCNCRCCHFSHPYQSNEKPVRARIKSVDPRGRILGFVDNVFDQKRGKRASMVVASASSQEYPSPQGLKRSRTQIEDNNSQRKSSGRQDRTMEPVSVTRSKRSDYHVANIGTPNCRNTEPPSTGTLGRRGSLREERERTEVGQLSQPVRMRNPRPHDPQGSLIRCEGELPEPVSVDHANTGSSKDEDSVNISILEKKLESLRRYADGLLELSLVDSHEKVLERISQVKSQIERLKRQKAEELFRDLNRDFPDLADLAREEARRRGL